MFAVVYGTVSGAIRRVIADDDGQIEIGTMEDGTAAVICNHPDGPPGYHPLLQGESATVETEGTWRQAVRSRTGEEPPILTCALIDASNLVTSVIMADPAIDQSPDARLMVGCYSSQIVVGCGYDPETGLFTTAEGLMPPHTPGNDTDDPIVVPPSVISKP